MNFPRQQTKSALQAVLPAPVLRRLGSALRRVRMRRLKSMEELDSELAKVEAAFSIGDEEGRRAFGSFYMDPPGNLPSDPFSVEYRDAQFELYRRVSGRATYSLENEHSSFNLEQAVQTPFPYQTRSARVVGDQLISQGCLLKAIPAKPPAELLEFGPGWGNTTLQLVQTGFRVTAVEIDPKFCEMIRRRGAAHAERLTVVESDMLSFRSTSKFDAAVFFESFHHCADHLQMLRNVKQLLKPGGAIVFGAEPIMDMAYPWGVRLDGESLWSIRKYGWLELGFDRTYFMNLLRQEGFTARRLHNPTLGHIAENVVAVLA